MKKENPIKPLTKENYLYVINSSIGSKQFKKFYVKQGNKKREIMKNGELSCAYFVSSILTLFNLIDHPHGTVDGTTKVLEKYGWKKAKKPKEGCLLEWEEEKSHKHIGFYIGKDRAISNSSKKKVPTRHHWTFGEKEGKPKRRIIAIYISNEICQKL